MWINYEIGLLNRSWYKLLIKALTTLYTCGDSDVIPSTLFTAAMLEVHVTAL